MATQAERDLKAAFEAGKTEARLDGHDERLNAINGSVARTAKGLEDLTQAVNTMNVLTVEREKSTKLAAELVKGALTDRQGEQDRTSTYRIKRWQITVGAAGILVSIAEATARLFGAGF